MGTNGNADSVAMYYKRYTRMAIAKATKTPSPIRQANNVANYFS